MVPACRLRRAPRGGQRARHPAAPGRRRGRRRALVLQGGRGGQRGRRVQPRHPARRARTRTRAALRWYERAAAAGHTEAALQVGIALLRDGDEQAAERHLRCAAGGGSAEAAFRLAARAGRAPAAARPRTSWASRCTEKTECEEWYERAAPQGHRRAQVRVGMLAAARGDVVEAARWYREAAEAGSRNGAFNLGLLLAREGSEPEAALWWTRAADAGHGRAALRLALLAARRGELAEGQRWAAGRWSWGRRRSPSGPLGCGMPCGRSSRPEPSPSCAGAVRRRGWFAPAAPTLPVPGGRAPRPRFGLDGLSSNAGRAGAVGPAQAICAGRRPLT